MSVDASPDPIVKKPRELSGRWVVVGIVFFASCLVAILYIYWSLHIGPFLPLQQAIVDEFPGSAPRVEGGQRKMHQNTPKILRITMKVDFDPTEEQERAVEFANRVARFSKDHYQVTDYEVFEIHLFWPEPEEKIKQWSTELKIADVVGS